VTNTNGRILKANLSWTTWRILPVKGVLGELQIYFWKIFLHQQQFLVVSVLSNSPWFREKFGKNVPNKTTSYFQLATRFYINGGSILLYLLRDDMN